MSANDGSKQFSAVRLALAIGIIWSVCVWAMGVTTVYTSCYARKMVEVLGSIYWGYEPGSWTGAFIGLAWAFADGFVGTLVIVGVYRLLSRCCRAAGADSAGGRSSD